MALKFYPSLLAALCVLLFVSTPVMARDGVTIPLPDNRTAVIAEGDLEAASTGSYSVTIFKDDSLMDFEAGAVFSRDGSLFQDDGRPRIKFADITGDSVAELIVSKLTAGSGNYLEVDALQITPHSIILVAHVQTETKQDAVAALKTAYNHNRARKIIQEQP